MVPTVKLPRADWDMILMLLEDNPGYITGPLHKEIEDQVYAQEY